MTQSDVLAEIKKKVLLELMVDKKVFTYNDVADAYKKFTFEDSPTRKLFMSNCYFQSGIAFQHTFIAKIMIENNPGAKSEFMQLKSEMEAYIKERMDSELDSLKAPQG